MTFMRRTLFKGAAGLAAVVSLDALWGGVAGAAEPSTGAGTTLERTFVRGTAGAGGYAPITIAPGEPYLLRRDLGPATSGMAGDGRVLASFAQLTDIHVMDVQSPARFEFLDAYGSLPIPVLSDLAFAYRPQEFMSAHVGEAMVQQLRRVRRGPATGHPLQFAVVTGDNTDMLSSNGTKNRY